MNMRSDLNSIPVEEILLDPTCRLDVLYWKKFAVDLNDKSEFSLHELGKIGDLITNEIKDEPVQREEYYTFKITYTGRVELTSLLPNSPKIKNMKIVEKGTLVFSRINCCRGAIGIVQDFQDKSICTNETYVYQTNTSSVDIRYLQIVLRHPYYQDRILSECTGASLERMRFYEDAFKAFKVPIPPIEKQLSLIKKITDIDVQIQELTDSIEKIRHARNKEVLSELGIPLEFSKEKGSQYGLSIDEIIENPLARMDFEHNRPTFAKIKKLNKGKFPLIEIANTDPNTRILEKNITSGNTPDGGIYPTKGISFIQGNNIEENKLDMMEHEFITKEFHDSHAKSKLRGGEVLVTIAGTIGKTAVNNEKDANVNQAIVIIRPNEKINPLFLSAFLNCDGGKIQFAKHRHDFGTPNINHKEVGKLKIPLPPRQTQDHIASLVEKYEQKISDSKTNLQNCIVERSEYITQFLIGEKKYQEVNERLK